MSSPTSPTSGLSGLRPATLLCVVAGTSSLWVHTRRRVLGKCKWWAWSRQSAIGSNPWNRLSSPLRLVPTPGNILSGSSVRHLRFRLGPIYHPDVYHPDTNTDVYRPVPVQSQHSPSTVPVQSQHSRSTVTVQFITPGLGDFRSNQSHSSLCFFMNT
eukprot:2659710-Pyramimonas_sp.AAC.1